MTTAERELEVILIIGDISGYTNFMLANRTSLIHAQSIISDLINTIIEQVEIPLKVAKLEGDAAFLYTANTGTVQEWEITRRKIGVKVLLFIEEFSRRAMELSMSTSCNCGACSNIDNLRLKVVIHSGQALMYRLGNFDELAGVDVIIVHRLLKNSVNSDQYILLTEAAYHQIEFIPKLPLTESTETYDGIGTIKTYTHNLAAPDKQVANLNSFQKATTNLGLKLKFTWQRIKNGLNEFASDKKTKDK